MTVQVQIAANAVVAKLVNADRDVKNIVSDLLSYRVDGAEFMHAFQSGSFNGISSFFRHATGTFPAGFVGLVRRELTKRGYVVQLVRRPHPPPLGAEFPLGPAEDEDPRYDYQMRALRQVEKHGRGIIRVATGGGKSRIAKLIAARFRRMTLFLTTRGVLMYQMKEGFEAARLNVGILGDGEWKVVRGVNVGMVQTLVARLEEPDLGAERRALVKSLVNKDQDFTQAYVERVAKERYDAKVLLRNRTIKILEMVEVVIGEEAHEASGNSYFQILKHCKNAAIRVALTATPFMKESMEDNMRLMAAFGDILISIDEKTLIERGILAKPYFVFHESEPHPKLRKTSPWQRAYQLGITESPARNADIVKYAVKAKMHGLTAMILVQRKQHGELLEGMLASAGVTAEFIRGENDQAERKKALTRLEKGKIDVLIGTTILDVGVDVPAVGMIILAGGGKAEVAMRQRIGRGLRAKKTGPNVCFVVDFADGLNTHLRDHYRQRRAIVESTPGFAENIVSSLPWSLFKAASAA